MIEPLDFAREVWKEFNLNNSARAGMTYFVDGVEVKSHGASTNTDDMKEMGNIFTEVKKDGERKSTKSTPTYSKTLRKVM